MINKLKDFIVLLFEKNSDVSSFPIAFDCKAEEQAHAEEQCLNAYPDCNIVLAMETNDPKEAFDYWSEKYNLKKVSVQRLKSGDYFLQDHSAWLGVKGFAVWVRATDEGVVVDIYNNADLTEPLASTYAFDSECSEEN